MIGNATVAAYRRDDFVVVPGMVGAAELAVLRQVLAEVATGVTEVETHDDVHDLEPGHTRAAPKIRRINSPPRSTWRSTGWCGPRR
jgi:hypothetical protein